MKKTLLALAFVAATSVVALAHGDDKTKKSGSCCSKDAKKELSSKASCCTKESKKGSVTKKAKTQVQKEAKAASPKS